VVRQVKVNALSQANLIKLLLEGEYTMRQLAEETGLHYVTVVDYTRALRRAGILHICAWELDRMGRETIRVYKLGEGKDVKPRKRLTPSERAARYRAKQKQLELIQITGGFAQ